MSAYPPGFHSWPLERRNVHFAQKTKAYRERKAAENLRPVPLTTANEWPAPQPIPDGLAPVAPFDMAFLPESIATWVADIAERMQCAPGFRRYPGDGCARRGTRTQSRHSPATADGLG